MRIAFIILITCCQFDLAAQDSITIQPLPRYTEFTGSLEHHTHFLSTAHATGINIGICQPLGTHFSVRAQSFLTPIKSFDASKAAISSTVNDNNVRTPSYNISSLTVVWTPFTGSNLSTGKRGQKQRDYTFGIRGGYFYNQLSYPSFNTIDYYQTDTTAIGEPRYILGTRSHALSAGLEFSITKKTAEKIVNMSYYADFLYGVHFSYVGYTQHNDGSYEAYSPEVGDYKINRKGVRIGFKYTHFRQGHWGGFCAVEAFWKPMLSYYAKSSYFIPRGGERLSPGAVSARVGVVYRIGK
ncbi:MAG: hypothetical protein A3D31_02880 [Candidatus Fluviicola riflensis]|nr:MAG: hypothetical protein CHH17_12160 [Candidatus Fluviicola riflensis]OGS78932.1 MAG: hypothetical protein A3D31_02880 [Candidatus Fluviicola riflensis]OGS85954.1 MAG: hypothetical protein A3E30_10365 [Fluviicola sp. RIFCSPHIGHO2_12_FULL_43_24]OGS86363.1 MAG: hypothetical protein A2724_02335 [Fluviicola sp. RIFCSPHIGHO2_01_FULL_43_53]